MNFLTARFRRLLDVNPVTLKELRQLVRSRIILWAMFLFPILLLAVDGLVVASQMPHAEPGKDPATLAYESLMMTAGPGVLAATAILLGLVTALVIPLMTGIRLTLETGRGRMDLQFVTALTAQDVVNGKLAAAFLVSLTFTALALPFLTLAYLMRGLDLATVGWTVLDLLAISSFLTAVSAAIGSLRMPVGLRMTFLIGGYVAFGLWMFIASIVLLVDLAYGGSTTDAGKVVIVHLVTVAVLFSGILLARAWAASNLMPPHTDFLRSLRRTELALLVVAWTAALATAACTGDDDYALPIPIVTSFVLTLVGVVALFHPAEVPRVVASRAPKSFFVRALAFPFTPTAAAGALFVALGQAVTLLVLVGTVRLTDSSEVLSEGLTGLLAVYGEITLLALAVMLVFRACHAGPRLYAFGPLITFVALNVLQMSGILEECGIVDDAANLFAYLPGIFDSPRQGHGESMHGIYFLLFLMAFLPYLAVDVRRAFRGFRRGEVGAK